MHGATRTRRVEGQRRTASSLPVQEEQDRRRSRALGRIAGRRQGRGDQGDDGATETLETKNIVIATGSDVAEAARASRSTRSRSSSPPPARSTLEKVPQKLLVVGAGVIGLELGSVWRRLGAKVTVVEFLDRILPGMDGEVALSQFQRMLAKQGMDVQARHQGYGRRHLRQERSRSTVRAGQGR
jgi:pyruvate/2-oxoglutarate dehydrogenase complex dihydrolipoamide dehydrogenase (E3) component